MARTPRSDIKIGNLEKKLGLGEGAIRNPNGTDARSDKLLKTLRKEYEKIAAGPPVRTSASVKKAAATAKAKTQSAPIALAKPQAAPKAKSALKATSGTKAKTTATSKPAAPKKAASKRAKK